MRQAGDWPKVDGYKWANAPGWEGMSDRSEAAGRPVHAINEVTSTTACGLHRKLWSVDLFNHRLCVRCLRALKIACPACKGEGSLCKTCLGDQTAKGKEKGETR